MRWAVAYRVGCGSSAVILREQGVQGGPLGLVQRGEDRLVGGGHRGLEPGDELDAGRRRVDALAALVAALGAALDEAAALEPLQEARDARRARAAHLRDVALDRTGVLDQVAEHEGLLVAELAAPDPVLAGLALSPADPADQLEAAGERLGASMVRTLTVRALTVNDRTDRGA